jgi:hypothetical protein
VSKSHCNSNNAHAKGAKGRNVLKPLASKRANQTNTKHILILYAKWLFCQGDAKNGELSWHSVGGISFEMPIFKEKSVDFSVLA